MTDYALMNQLLYEGKHREVKAMTEEALAAGLNVDEVLEDGLIAGMRVVGEDFKHNRIFVPEVLLAARAMKGGMEILRPLLTARKDAGSQGTVVMGTVKGDLHDIGKNLVGMMAEGAGFTIVDLGTDTSADEFIRAVKIAVGGAPVTPQFCNDIGADGYAADAASAVELFKKLVAARKEARAAV